MKDTVQRLREVSNLPPDEASFAAWLELKDAIAFLKDHIRQDQFVLYAAPAHSFLHAILVPASLVNPPDVEDLMSWNCNATSSWGITSGFSPPTLYMSPPLEHTGSETLDRGKQLVFARRFEGRLGSKSYYEIAQDFAHVSDLHFMPERRAYCRIDDRGDIEETVRIFEAPDGGPVVTVKRDILDQYMTLTDSTAVLTFDFTRWRSPFNGWPHPTSPKRTDDGELSYRTVIVPGYASYMRGFQIVRSRLSKEALLKRFDHSERDKGREYASFIVQDWKNGVVREVSAAPGQTANYFTKSDLPFEISPAFFRPEVLLKYKADSEKYKLEDRSISCRGAWHLETYDINEAGQVHTYIVYLRHLPYEEQLYWKAHNEAPKAPISERALKTDFEGRWDSEYDPLESLRGIATTLARERVPWWSLRSDTALDQVHYPVTASADEWANELLHLDQLVIEGFEEEWLRARAESLGGTPDPQSRSLKLLEGCLVGIGFEADHAKQIVGPLHEAHRLRSKLKGHVSGDEGTAIKRETLARHKTYVVHFRTLCQRCDESMRTIHKAFGGQSAALDG